MATFLFNAGIAQLMQGLDLSTDTLKLMLLDNTYIPTQGDDFIDLGGGTGIVAAEIDVTNYTPGFASADRKTLGDGNKVFDVNDTTNRVTFDYSADFVFTSLGAGATIHAAVLYLHTGAADTDCIPIAYLELTSDIPTNGSSVTITVNASGFFYIQTV